MWLTPCQWQLSQPTIGPSHSHPDPGPRLASLKTAQQTGQWEATPTVPFLNLDPIAHLVGESSEAPITNNGQKVTMLINSGAQVSSVSSWFCKWMTLKVHPLDRLLSLEGTGGLAIQYLGYVEVNLQIPGIKGYNEDILLLGVPTTAYSEKLPFMVGSNNIDRAKGLNTKGKLVRATMTWKQAHFGAAMSRLFQLPHKGARGDGMLWRGSLPSTASKPTMPKEFSLDNVQGHVHTTQRSPFLCLGPSIYMATQTLKGTVCRSTCLLSQHQVPSCSFPLYHPTTYGELQPGSFQVPICLWNLSSHPIVVVIGKVTLANQVPLVVLPMGALGESAHGPEKDGILKELNLQDLEEWSKEEQDKARKLLVKWEHLFACNNLDLGMTSLIKHQIKLTDQMPFNECYWHISPHMYDDVKAHLKEMLDIGAIQKSHRPWASTVVLVQKKDRSLRFCIDHRKLNHQTIKDAYLLPHIKETVNSLQGPNDSLYLTWRLGTGRLRWTRRANHWLHLLWGNWDSMSVIECPLGWPTSLLPSSNWWKPASGTSTLIGVSSI